MGLLLAGLGGMASQGIDIINKRQEEEQAQAKEARNFEQTKKMAEYQEQLAAKRAEAVAAIKSAQEKKEQEEKAARSSREAQAIEEGAAKRQTTREVTTANVVAPSVTPETMGLLKSQLTPEQMKKFYGVEKATKVDMADDQIAEARKIGAYEAEKGLLGARNSAVTELNNERKDANAKAEIERKTQADKDDKEAANRRIDALFAKAGAANANKPAFVATYEFLESKGYPKAEIESILTEKKGTSVEDIATKLITSDPNSGRRNALTPEAALEKAQQIKSVVSSTKKADTATGNVGKSTVSALPKGAVQIGTSGGKPVYQTPDGKKFKAD